MWSPKPIWHQVKVASGSVPFFLTGAPLSWGAISTLQIRQKSLAEFFSDKFPSFVVMGSRRASLLSSVSKVYIDMASSRRPFLATTGMVNQKQSAVILQILKAKNPTVPQQRAEDQPLLLIYHDWKRQQRQLRFADMRSKSSHRLAHSASLKSNRAGFAVQAGGNERPRNTSTNIRNRIV